VSRLAFRSRWSRSAVIASAAAIVCACSQPAFGQHAVTLESPARVTAALAALLSATPSFSRPAPPRLTAIAPLPGSGVPSPSPRRPAALPALYVSFAVLQGLDAHSTLTAVGAGRTEANPAVKGLVARPATFLAAKLAATAGTLYLTERLWKKHRAAALVLMVAVNATYGAIVANNYRSSGGIR
jgi:hypothetical protein